MTGVQTCALPIWKIDDNHTYVWNELHPEDPICANEMIHHKNGDHNDNHPDNLIKIQKCRHGEHHKKLDEQHGITKHDMIAKDITTEVPKKVL